MPKIIYRKAKIDDVKEILHIVNYYAKKELMLFLSLNKVYENLRDFTVAVDEETNEVVGCGALHIVWEDLAEVRSVAIKEEYRNQHIGKNLIIELINEAKEIGLKRIFLLTYQKDFFSKLGFKVVDKQILPHKIWSDCINCPKFPICDEIAMIKDLV